MEIVETLAKIVGIGGAVVGTLLVIFREIIRKRIFTQFTREQSFKIIKLIIVLTWTVTMLGMILWYLLESERVRISAENESGVTSPVDHEELVETPVSERMLVMPTGDAFDELPKSEAIGILEGIYSYDKNEIEIQQSLVVNAFELSDGELVLIYYRHQMQNETFREIFYTSDSTGTSELLLREIIYPDMDIFGHCVLETSEQRFMALWSNQGSGRYLSVDIYTYSVLEGFTRVFDTSGPEKALHSTYVLIKDDRFVLSAGGFMFSELVCTGNIIKAENIPFNIISSAIINVSPSQVTKVTVSYDQAWKLRIFVDGVSASYSRDSHGGYILDQTITLNVGDILTISMNSESDIPYRLEGVSRQGDSLRKINRGIYAYIATKPGDNLLWITEVEGLSYDIRVRVLN